MDSDGDSIILKAILSTPEKETDPEITTSPSDETSCSKDKKEEVGAEEEGGGEGGTGISTCEPVDSSVGDKSEGYEASVEKGITNDSDSVFKEEGGVVSEDVACSTNDKSGRWYLFSSLCFCTSVPQSKPC